MPITIAICDDSEEHSAELRRLLGDWAADKPFALMIDEYVSAENFLFQYPDKPCSLLFLDIEMKNLNGMELAHKLRADGDMLPIRHGLRRLYERRLRGRGSALSVKAR